MFICSSHANTLPSLDHDHSFLDPHDGTQEPRSDAGRQSGWGIFGETRI